MNQVPWRWLGRAVVRRWKEYKWTVLEDRGTGNMKETGGSSDSSLGRQKVQGSSRFGVTGERW